MISRNITLEKRIKNQKIEEIDQSLEESHYQKFVDEFSREIEEIEENN